MVDKDIWPVAPIGNELVGRTAIDWVISGANARDVQSGLANLKSVLSNGRKYNGKCGLILQLTDPSISNVSKSIALFINKSWRTWSQGAALDSVAALKDLLWLRDRLRSRALDTGESAGSTIDAGQPLAASDSSLTNLLDYVQHGITLVYELCVGRCPTPQEIQIWSKNLQDGVSFPHFLCLMHDSSEGTKYRESQILLPELSDGLFIQILYEAFYSRGCTASEIAHWQRTLASGAAGRSDVFRDMFDEYAKAAIKSKPDPFPTIDPQSFHVMGTGQYVTVADWKIREKEIAAEGHEPTTAAAPHSRFYIKRAPALLVTAIASLYRGGRFIEQFMDNITTQSCFRDYCELIIVDADSPDNESEVIDRFCKHRNNIVYQRVNHRIGIYEAWNIAVKLARGEYLTNTNLDDIRRCDSIELQASVLDNLSFVDVVYQDFYYSFDFGLTFQQIARFGYKSNLPVITAHNMMNFNSPHNAPMWRKRLHDAHGQFDPSYTSAGDYEFWMRCLAAKCVFYKINDAHVVYYQNPHGLSTGRDSRGVDEAKRILKTYARRLISNDVVMPLEQFMQSVSPEFPVEHSSGDSRYRIVQSALRETAATLKSRFESNN
ncbi:MAG: glycosyltransferase [Steroidobacteraceae bacterium]